MGRIGELRRSSPLALLVGVAAVSSGDAVRAGTGAGRRLGGDARLAGADRPGGPPSAGESLPARRRSMGSSAMLTSNLVANAIVTAVFLTMLGSLGGAGTFAVFGALAGLSLAFVSRYAPETKGCQLEDIRRFWENGGRWPEHEPEPAWR